MKTKNQLVQGAGINDADYAVWSPYENCKRQICPFYLTWKGMLERVYSAKYHEKYPTYKYCTHDEGWLKFSNFKSWMEQQDWKGKALDKDIIHAENKHYGPETCCFVTQAVNKLLNDNATNRGDLPQGVAFDNRRGNYRATVSVNGKRKHIGTYDTVEGAERAYRSCKSLVIAIHANREPDERVAAGLWKHAELYRVIT